MIAKIGKTNGLQMLSHILSLSELSVRDGVERCEALMEALRQNKLKLSSDYYAAIGLLAILPTDIQTIVDDMVAITDYFKTTKGYKWLGKGMHILLASAIIANSYASDEGQKTLTETTISLSTQAIIAAQQAAMIAAITAATASSSASAT